MSTNSVYYWQNYLDKEREFTLKQDSYIIQVVIVNQSSGDIYSEWISFPTEDELLGLLNI